MVSAPVNTLEHTQIIVRSVLTAQIGKTNIIPKFLVTYSDGSAITRDLNPAATLDTVADRETIEGALDHCLQVMGAASSAVMLEVESGGAVHAVIKVSDGEVSRMLLPMQRGSDGRITGFSCPPLQSLPAGAVAPATRAACA